MGRGIQYNITNTQTQYRDSGVFNKKLTNMKHVIWILLIASSAYAQKNLPEYKASNGITYTAGDTVKLGTGSGPSHEFLYVLTGSGISLTRAYSRAEVVIKKIHRVKFRGIDKVYFEITPGRNLLYIEDAIEYCEVEDCKREKPSN